MGVIKKQGRNSFLSTKFFKKGQLNKVLDKMKD